MNSHNSRNDRLALSRRRALRAAGIAAVTTTTGCLGSVREGIASSDEPPLTERDGEVPTQTIPDGAVQFRGSVERWGYYPDERVPDAVEREWRFDELNQIDHNAAKASAVPLPDGGVVLPGDTGHVRAFEPDGEVRWTAETDFEDRGVHGTPAVVDDTVYIGAYDGICYAFDAATGEEVWQTRLGDYIGSSPLYFDDRLFVAVEYSGYDGSIFAVDPDDGAVRWEDAERRPDEHPHSTPAIDPETGTLVVGANDGLLYGWDTSTLELAWTFETDPHNDTDGEIKGPVATYDGGAFFGSWDGRIYRVDLEAGTEDWSFDTGRSAMTGPGIDPTLNAVFAGSHDGNMYAFDADTGEEAWRFGTDWRILSSPTVCADRLVFGSDDRTLYAVAKRSGEEVWHVDLDGYVSSTPLVYDGAIYVAERAPNPPDPEEDQDESEIDTDGGGYKFVAAE